jgi:hypothetical protein
MFSNSETKKISGKRCLSKDAKFRRFERYFNFAPWRLGEISFPEEANHL